jgi:hypothetical protein
MQFILTGFTQDTGFRVFAFEGVAIGQIRVAFTVRADLALSRRYGIAMQELPLLCRSLLDRQEESGANQVENGHNGHQSVANHALTFSEEEMRACADKRTADRALAALKRKTPRRPIVENAGAAWRGPQP